MTAGDRTLVFTVATNGYARLFRRNLESHETYARRFGYDCRAFVDAGEIAAADSSWLKLPLLLHALADGYGLVLFVDADCYISKAAPPLTAALDPEKHVYMGVGQSGRVNAGVILTRNHPASVALWERVVAGRTTEIPPECRAPYENGHVIFHTTGSPIVGVLDRRWNDHSVHDGTEYIRHGGGVGRRPWARAVRKVLHRLSPRDQRLMALRGASLEERARVVWQHAG